MAETVESAGAPPAPPYAAAGAASGPAGRLAFPLMITTVSLGGVLAPLNSTMLAVALPEIRRDFGVGHAEIAWLVSAYLIAMAVAQPLGGRLGDQLGRAWVFRAGLLLFLGLSVAAAFAPTFLLLVLMRTGQALVGAAVMPNGMAMLRESLPPDRLGRSLGYFGSAVSAAAATGPLLGAGLLALSSFGGWRLLFLMNVPLVMAALSFLALLAYPPGMRSRQRPELDWAGAAAFAGMLVTVTLLLNALRTAQGALMVVTIVALPVLAVAFVRRQFSTSSPMAEWRLFRIRSYSAATAYILLSNLVMYTTILSVPFFVEEVQGKGALVTGSLLGAVSVPVALLAPVGGRLSDSFGRRLPAAAGSILLPAGMAALLLGMDAGTPYLLLLVVLGMVGVGLGLSIGPASAAAIESSPREMAGTAAGTNSMMRYVGSIIGAGVLGAVLNTESAVPGIELFQMIFAVLLVMAALAWVSSLGIHRFPPPEGAASRAAGQAG